MLRSCGRRSFDTPDNRCEVASKEVRPTCVSTHSLSENIVRVKIYSLWFDKYKTAPVSQFEFSYQMTGPAEKSK